jgi:hypothetical protein
LRVVPLLSAKRDRFAQKKMAANKVAAIHIA